MWLSVSFSCHLFLRQTFMFPWKPILRISKHFSNISKLNIEHWPLFFILIYIQVHTCKPHIHREMHTCRPTYSYLCTDHHQPWPPYASYHHTPNRLKIQGKKLIINSQRSHVFSSLTCCWKENVAICLEWLFRLPLLPFHHPIPFCKTESLR